MLLRPFEIKKIQGFSYLDYVRLAGRNKMADNDVRKDYLSNRWVVIAKERKKRPTDFAKSVVETKEAICPLCPGNEHMTPPAVLVYLSFNGEILKENDQNGYRHKNWIVRVVPNLYPAFAPPDNEKEKLKETSVLKRAIGHHEVLIESPNHNEHPGVSRVSQLVHVVNAYLDRLADLTEKPYVNYVSIFRNHRREAGASLSHAHTQLIATPLVPSLVKEELDASKNFWKKNHGCLLCDVLKREKEGPRFIWENSSFVVFAPWASINPLEFWVLPKRHHSSMLSQSQDNVKDLAETMRVCLGGLRSLLNDPPYNFGFHTVSAEEAQDCYHWHLEVYPRLTIWAGFEKSTGMFINVISPEDAAAELKSAVQTEKKHLAV
jgi:UDPglucose--hexose-1-phosphate uridylyltransferase